MVIRIEVNKMTSLKRQKLMKFRKYLFLRDWLRFKMTRGVISRCTQQSACSFKQFWSSWALASFSLDVRTTQPRQKFHPYSWTLFASSAWPFCTCHWLMMLARIWMVWSLRWTTLISSRVQPQHLQLRSCRSSPAYLLRLQTIWYWSWRVTLLRL